MPNKQNVAAFEALQADLDGVQAVWAVDYRGLTVKEFEQLRHNIRETGATMRVYKNTIMKLGLADANLASMDEILEGPSAFVFAKEEPVSPAKALKDFSKANPNLVLKGGVMEGEFKDVAALEAIAALPSKDQLLGQIANSLTGVASQLAIALGEMSEKTAA